MAKDKANIKKHLFFYIRIIVVLVGIGGMILWLSNEQTWENVCKAFAKIRPSVLLLTIIIYSLCQILVASRWWLLLKSQQIKIKISAAIRLHFLGLFYNNAMPGSVGGDLVRAWYVTKHTQKKTVAALSVFVDRIIGFASTLTIAAFFYIVFLRGKGKSSIITYAQSKNLIDSVWEHKNIVLIIIITILLMIALTLTFPKGRRFFKNFFSRFKVFLLALFSRLKESVLMYGKNPSIIFAVFWLSVVSQIVSISPYWLLGKDIGINVDMKYYYVFFTLTWVLGGIPITIGGAVVTESVLALLFIKITGVQQEPAVALALCQRIVWMITSLPGAVIHLTGAHLPKDFSIDYSQPSDKLK